MDDFRRKFSIFRHNLDAIKRHSCVRSVTLFKSLKSRKSFDSLNNIDTLDPRRSYNDDLNLDRYKFFSVPDLSKAPAQVADSLRRESAKQQQQQWTSFNSNNGRQSTTSAGLSRAGISYRREPFFSSLLENGRQMRNQQQQQQPLRVNNQQQQQQLTRENLLIQRRIYDLVMQRYRYCMKTVRNINLSASTYLPQQCQAAGLLADQAINLSWNSGTESQFNSEASLALQKEDQCAFYRLGLEPWAEGLIKQDSMSAQLIQSAKCS